MGASQRWPHGIRVELSYSVCVREDRSQEQSCIVKSTVEWRGRSEQI